MPSRPRSAWPRGSLRTQITLWNTSVTLLVTTLSLVIVHVATRSLLYRDADVELRSAAREVALAVRELHPDIEAVVDEMRRKAASHEERGWFMHLLTPDGRTIWRSARCPDAVAEFPPVDTAQVETLRQVDGFRYARMRIADPGHGSFLVRVGMSTAMLETGSRDLMAVLLGVGGVLTLVIPGIGYLLAARATRPIAEILRTAARLQPSRLADRLHIRGTHDELDELSTTINRLLDQVAQHVDRQEQFVADAAHELRGPLAAVRSSLEIAVAREGDRAAQRETLEDILDATRHLSKITNDLLLLAEIRERSHAVEPEAVDLVVVTRQAVTMFTGVAEERGVALSVEAGGPTPIVAGDADRIRRVVVNLLDNALRFTGEGGSIRVRIAADPATGSGMLALSDSGVGIPEAHLPHVFERFSKADAARSHAGARRSGGLGLAICKGIVESCGGTITIASRIGEGTTVTIRLPAAQPVSPPRRAPAGRRSSSIAVVASHAHGHA